MHSKKKYIYINIFANTAMNDFQSRFSVSEINGILKKNPLMSCNSFYSQNTVASFKYFIFWPKILLFRALFLRIFETEMTLCFKLT